MITTKSAVHLVLLAISGGACCWAEPQVAIRLLDADQIRRLDLRTAKDIASTILATAGVQVRWQNGGALHTAAETIDIRFTHSMPRRGTPTGVLAERIAIRVVRYAVEERVLGHVLAHEIGHVLKGNDGHSLTGVMKAHWDYDDCRAMRAKTLEFTGEDAAIIASRRWDML